MIFLCVGVCVFVDGNNLKVKANLNWYAPFGIATKISTDSGLLLQIGWFFGESKKKITWLAVSISNT